METNNKILIEEETLDKAYKMLDKLRDHYLDKAENASRVRFGRWHDVMIINKARAAEVEEIMDAIYAAQSY